MENLKVVDIFIGTTLRGSAKGSGRAMYIMRTKRKNGSDYEAAPQIVEYDNTTESESVLPGCPAASPLCLHRSDPYRV